VSASTVTGTVTIAIRLGRQALEAARPPAVGCAPDLSHPDGAQPACDLIRSEPRADGQRHR